MDVIFGDDEAVYLTSVATIPFLHQQQHDSLETADLFAVHKYFKNYV
jgi:hypothetical protein